MSRTFTNASRARFTRSLLTFAAASLSATGLRAQAALGNPFIGANNISYQTAELTRSGGAQLTRVHGVSYAHRFGKRDRATQISMNLRGSARAFEDVDAGVVDLGGAVAVSHDVSALRGLSLAASAGVGVMAWNDDVSKTGRAQITVPLTTGVSYDVRIRSATFAPFATASIARSDLRTSLDDVQQTRDAEWDARYSSGMSLRFNRIVLTSTRIIGEVGMPYRSRWAFSAGISF